MGHWAFGHKLLLLLCLFVVVKCLFLLIKCVLEVVLCVLFTFLCIWQCVSSSEIFQITAMGGSKSLCPWVCLHEYFELKIRFLIFIKQYHQNCKF